MKLSIVERFGPRKARRSRTSLLVSVALHVVAAALLARIAFHYDVGGIAGIRRPPTVPERIQYVRIAPTAPAAGGAGAGATTPARGTPPRLRAPDRVPAAVPSPAEPAATGTPDGKTGGEGTGSGSASGGAAGSGAATGITPSFSDPRLWGPPGAYVTAPKTPAQRVDSAIKAAFQIYLDSVTVAAANKGRDPGDWTVKRGGEKWGVDQRWIHLGKYKLPTALLAALPLNVQGNPNYTGPEGRARAFVRQDILYHAQRAVSEDEFRDAIKRIRERKDRERDEARRVREETRP